MNSDVIQGRGDAVSNTNATPYVEAIFAFEIQQDPWQMQLVDFCPHPTPESGIEFLERAYDSGFTMVHKGAGGPDGSVRWLIAGQSDDLIRSKLLVEFASELYDQWQDVGLSIPSEVKRDGA